jgi:hypothetical protein
MASTASNHLTRIGVFYDGNFFFHVSNYYQYHHERRARISVAGLHEFIRHQVADAEGSDVKYCQIVDAHYFRGRPKAQDAEKWGVLLRERAFDDVLVREGVVTHYLPLGPDGEKGIDVWLALEAYELAIYKRFDVSVLVACDGDFLPLVRKLNTLGTRVMLLAWDFKYTDQNNQERETRTAQVLLDEVSYPVMMGQVIGDRSRRNDPQINGLFVPHKEIRVHEVSCIRITGSSRHAGFQSVMSCLRQSEDQGAISGVIVHVQEHSGKQPRPFFRCEDFRIWVILVVRVQLSAGCHNRFFPSEIGCNFRRIRLSVFNRIQHRRERQFVIRRKFLGAPWFFLIDMRPIQQFSLNPCALNEELSVKGSRSWLQILVFNARAHTCSVHGRHSASKARKQAAPILGPGICDTHWTPI